MAPSPNDHPGDAPRPGRLRRGRVVLVALLAALFAWVTSGIYTVAPSERAVVTRFGRLAAKKDRPGIHYALPWPIDRVYTPETTDVKRIEVGFKNLGQLFSEPRRSDALTGDENILKIMMVVQYKIRDVERYLFRVEEPPWLVERAVETAMNLRVASLPVDDVLTDAKARIEIDTIAIAQGWLDAYQAGIVLLRGNLQTVSPPVPVLDAFNEVTDAKKDAERMIDEAREYEGKVVPQARGEAHEIVKRAEGYLNERTNQARGEADRFLSVLAEYRQARDITRTRLYVEAMEDLLSKMEVLISDGTSEITIVE